MLAVDFALWLVKTVGGQAVRDRFTRRGLTAQVRSLQKALIDSQNERAALHDIHELASSIAHERDLLQAEVIRLRIENAELRTRLAGRL